MGCFNVSLNEKKEDLTKLNQIIITYLMIKRKK